MRILSRSDVERVLDYPSCIAAVEGAFAARGRGDAAPSAVLGLHARDGGFHVKAAMLRAGGRDLFAAKINANFPGNPLKHRLPTIQGMLGLFDAGNGTPLALMDSMSVTTIRTAAATAVAVKHLAPRGAKRLAIIGCGVQAAAHVAALREVHEIAHVVGFDTDAGERHAFAHKIRREFGLPTSAAGSVADAVAGAGLIVTCTPSRAAFLDESMIAAGAFIGAVGADNEHKSEIAPSLMTRAAVVVDDLDQCAAIGDLHHAIAAGAMKRESIRATLAEVVADTARGRRNPDEVVVFDSTGVAIEDVAAAAVAFERAEAQGIGNEIPLGS
jgi:alanine dehydrogenase